MSFILDALKKSELERQRQSAPGLVEAGIVRPRPRLPLWAIALTTLLAVNLLVLAVLWSRGVLSGAPRLVASGPGSAGMAASNDAAPAPAAAPGVAVPSVAADGAALTASSVAQGAAPSAVPLGGTPASPVPGARADRSGDASRARPAQASTTHFSPMEGAGEFAPEIPVSQDEPVAPAPPPVRAARHHEPKPIAQDDEPPEEMLPSISEIKMTGPELHLDVHVYATQPADRFVYINMRKYREGQTLEEGPTVERIRRDGVVLAYQGVRFLLPRQH